MQTAPILPNEADRLCAVFNLKILDTAIEERFELITKEAIDFFKVPISTISILDKDREWYKSAQGIEEREGPRNISFCGHALHHEDILIIEDTLKDPTFSDNPYVVRQTRPIRFYAGKALLSYESTLPVGVFCIKDHQPRTMHLTEIAKFLDLAHRAEIELNKKENNLV